jgi:hypothetical protein
MTFRLNRATAFLLVLLLWPLVRVIRVWQSLTGYRKPEYAGTIEGDPMAYAGDKPLLIAVWGEYATVWTAATADVVEQLKAEFADRCEFTYVEESREVREKYQAEVVPVLILRHRGQELGRFVNTVEADEVRPAITAAIA